MTLLTAEEIAHYARAHAADEMSVREYHEVFPFLLDEVERSRALLKRLERSPREGQGSYGWAECPDCRRATMTRQPINHEPGCELAALIAGTEAAPNLLPVLQRLVDAVTESGRKGVVYLGPALGDAREALRLSGVRPG